MSQKSKFFDRGIEQKFGQILQVNLNSTSKARVLRRVRDFISYKRKFSLVTPNPEIILLAQKDPQLLTALNRAELAIPDGIGLKLAKPSLKIIKGRELFLSLISLANKKGWRVFLLGGLDNEAKIAATKLKLKNSKLKIKSAAGPVLDNDAKPVTKVDIKLQSDIVARINQFRPHLLFVGFGAPKQEKWIAKWLPKLNIGGAMTVGGTFRYLAGLAKLPPAWLANLGLEWLWRAVHEPKRIGRVFNAVIIFPLRVFWSKLSK